MTFLFRKLDNGALEGVSVSDKLVLSNPEAYIHAVINNKQSAQGFQEAQQRDRFLRRLNKALCLYCEDSGNITVSIKMENGVDYPMTFDCICSERTIRLQNGQEVKSTNIGSIATHYFPKCALIKDGTAPDETYHPDFCKVSDPEEKCLAMITNGHCPKYYAPPRVKHYQAGLD